MWAEAVRPDDDAVGRVLEAVGWLGRAPQSRVLPPALIASVGVFVGPHAAAWQLASWAAAPFGTLLKRAIGRGRPPTAVVPILGSRASGPSFPSTHVLTYTAFYGHLGWLLVRSGRPWLALPPLGLIVLIGPSRLRAGDHWFTDVAAGYVLGAAILGAVAIASRNDHGLETELATTRSNEAPGAPRLDAQSPDAELPRHSADEKPDAAMAVPAGPRTGD